MRKQIHQSSFKNDLLVPRVCTYSVRISQLRARFPERKMCPLPLERDPERVYQNALGRELKNNHTKSTYGRFAVSAFLVRLPCERYSSIFFHSPFVTVGAIHESPAPTVTLSGAGVGCAPTLNSSKQSLRSRSFVEETQWMEQNRDLLAG